MNLKGTHLIQIAHAICSSKCLMGLHLCNNSALNQKQCSDPNEENGESVKNEIYTILGINIQK